MVSALEDIADAYAVGFDAEREVFLGDSARLLLLKKKGTDVAYTVKETIDSGWMAEFSDFFSRSTFYVADLSTNLRDKVKQSDSLVVQGSDNESLNNVVYDIKSDTQAPLGEDPFWRIRAESTGAIYS